MKSKLLGSTLADLTSIQNAFNTGTTRLDDVFPQVKSFLNRNRYLMKADITQMMKVLVVRNCLDLVVVVFMLCDLLNNYDLFTESVRGFLYIDLTRPTREMVSLLMGLDNDVHSGLYSILTLPNYSKKINLMTLSASPFEILLYVTTYTIINKYKLGPPRLLYTKPVDYPVIKYDTLFRDGYLCIFDVMSMCFKMDHLLVLSEFSYLGEQEGYRFRVGPYLEYNGDVLLDKIQANTEIDYPKFSELLETYHDRPDDLDGVIRGYWRAEWTTAVLRVFRDESILMFLSILKLIRLEVYSCEYIIHYKYITHSYIVLARRVYDYPLDMFLHDEDYTPVVTPFIILRLFSPTLFIGASA
jgi:hypothetical protein